MGRVASSLARNEKVFGGVWLLFDKVIGLVSAIKPRIRSDLWRKVALLGSDLHLDAWEVLVFL